MKKATLLLLLTGIGAIQLQAQSPWLSDTRVTSVSLEWDKPLFDDRTFDRDEISGTSSVLFITGRVRVNDNFRVIAELPMSHFGYENNNPFGGDDNSTSIGNIYAGGALDFNQKNPKNHSFVEFGVRIPTSRSYDGIDRFGNTTAQFSEIERREAFGTDNWAIPVIGNYITPVSGPFAVKLRLGTVYDIYVDELKDLDNEFHLLYGLTGLYRKPTVEAHLGFSGRNPYIGNDPDFFDNGFTQIRAGVARPFNNFTPGIYLRKPLGENYNQLIDMAYGFSIEIRR